MSPLVQVATTATIPDIITFVVAGAVILSGAIGVVTSRNPVHAALFLVMTLFGVAVLFIEQQADFLAAVQVIVYAGAIVVLFLFVIMFLGVDRTENVEVEPLRGQRPLALFLIAVAVIGILVMASHSHWATGAHAVAGPTTGPGSDVAKLGRSVFTTYLWAFEITSALLVIAVVGAVVLARRPPTSSGDIEAEETTFEESGSFPSTGGPAADAGDDDALDDADGSGPGGSGDGDSEDGEGAEGEPRPLGDPVPVGSVASPVGRADTDPPGTRPSRPSHSTTDPTDGAADNDTAGGTGGAARPVVATTAGPGSRADQGGAGR